MNTSKVCCVSCGHATPATAATGDYVRQAVESQPCPRCGAYTLKCTAPSGTTTRLLRHKFAKGLKR